MKNGLRKEPYGSMVLVGLLFGIYAVFLFTRSQPGFATAIVLGAVVLVGIGVWGMRKSPIKR